MCAREYFDWVSTLPLVASDADIIKRRDDFDLENVCVCHPVGV